MLKIAGVILCIAGSVGYGIMKISGWKQAIKELEEWILLFENVKSHIQYRRDIISEVFCRMDKELYGIGGKYVAAVGQGMQADRTKNLIQEWEERMFQWKQTSFLPADIKNSIMAFPEYIGEQDCEQQIHRLDFYLQKLHTKKEKLEKELSSKRKPVMAISMVGGIMVSVLLI